jgi:hypothetical protein
MSAQYFAQLDDNNIVTHVAVVTREFLEANPDRYQGTWVETFFDSADKQYAGIGFIYHQHLCRQMAEHIIGTKKN